ncbi:hypothetical protein JTB14_009084 [Gonioctena quinquepunctata]|nr:hypothetical protein JTB14_009084 [Gonioctena quinquepunctata]
MNPLEREKSHIMNDIDKFCEFVSQAKTLKCSFCSYPLSVPPIMIISEDGTEHRCGRCKDIECTTTIRNTFLESMAQLLTFPCIYANCHAEISWKDVTAHEEECKFKTIKCPVYYQGCQEMVRNDQFEDHMKNHHEKNIHYKKMVFSLRPESTYACLLITYNVQFFVYYYKYRTSVVCIKPNMNKNFIYNVKLSNKVNKSYSILLEDQYVDEFDDKLHCFECIDGNFNLNSHNHLPSKLSDRNLHYHKFSIDHISNIFENPQEITFTVDIIPTKKYSKSKVSRGKTYFLRQILEENLVCPVCKEYMVSPIYTCERGHAICSKCLLKSTRIDIKSIHAVFLLITNNTILITLKRKKKNILTDMTSKFIKLAKALKCSQCSNPLTLSALHGDGTEHFCSRCNTTIRKTILQILEPSWTFPCSYCSAKLPWDDVSAHEKKCIFKTIKCPVYYQGCQEMVNIDQFEDHMQKKHHTNIHYEKMVVSFHPQSSYVCLLIAYNVQFLVYYYENDGFCVVCLEPDLNENFTYNMKVTVENKMYSILLENQFIDDFIDKYHCFECIDTHKCISKGHFPSYDFTDGDLHYHEFRSMDHMRNILESPKITFTVDIIPKKKYLSENTTKFGKYFIEKEKEKHLNDMDKFHELSIQTRILKCSFCLFPLSVSPIMTISEDGTKYRCGRCKDIDIECTTTIRNVYLESVTQLLTFPCIHANCPDEIPWKDVTAHEKECQFKSIKCPVYYQNCQEMVRIDKLEVHMQKKHEQNIHYEKMVFGLALNHVYVCLLISHNIQFFIYYYKYRISVFCLKPDMNKNFTYNVKLSNEVNKLCNISFENLYIDDFDDKLHCSECIIKSKCDLNNHSYKFTDRNFHCHEFSSTMENINNILENPHKITFTVDIIPKKEFLSENTTKFDMCSYKNDFLRESLECPVCFQYMVGPIYTCEKGHAICSKCKLEISICYCCKANIGETRIFALENIAENVTLSCVYGNNGGTFVGKLESVSKHEPNCSHNE